MIDLENIRAIDIHTHAEEPCGCHADDGYDDLQATMHSTFVPLGNIPPRFQKRRSITANKILLR